MDAHTNTTHRRLRLLLMLTLLGLPARYAAADAYTDKVAAVARLERTGRFDRAADAQAELARRYPQDYEVVLRLGWLAYRAGRYAQAERAYSAALRLSPAALDARLGLAWALAKEGAREQAAQHFNALAKEAPENASIVAGLRETASSPAANVLTPLAGFGVLAYDGHALKRWALATTVGLALRAGRFQLVAAYRYSYFSTSRALGSLTGALGPGPGQPPPPPPPPPPPAPPGAASSRGRDGFAQHETYLTTRYDGERFGIAAQYAYVYDGSGEFGHIQAGGIALRYSPFGDLTLAGNVGAYTDLTAWRGVLSWRLPLLSLGVTPAFAVQRVGERTRVAGELGVDLRWRWLGLAAGGRYGAQERLAYLERLIVYNVPETVLYGGWASVGLTLGRLGLGISYGVDRYEDSSGRLSLGHYVGLTLTFDAHRF